ncbi:TspO/MBR family protein [Terricaulis sp.]|uniref:TspO/MBR family protein n=1 Tax=Terricaulis sp. TaxID=2768686 RepID=UPI002AC736D6|nr:TspO/MBR family protein [Terricaulis sp.]MDZ4691333.1 TspO/MBR family protein [Terricaulis sp.]
MSGKWRPIAVAAAAAVFVGALGSTVTDLGPWYQALQKPDWQPPGPAFGAIWTTIYALTAAAAVVTWRRAPKGAEREWLIGLFALNGFLNVLWSLLFFRVHRPDWSLIEVAFLWLSIVALIVFTSRHARLAGVLLTPYLIWVSIAAVLNFEVVRLNGPFG